MSLAPASSTLAEAIEARLSAEDRAYLRSVAARLGVSPHRWYRVTPCYELAETLAVVSEAKKRHERGQGRTIALQLASGEIRTKSDAIRSRLRRWGTAYTLVFRST